MKITGRASEAHCADHAQLEKQYSTRLKKKIFRNLVDPVTIKTEDSNSKLRQSFNWIFQNFVKEDKKSYIDTLNLIRKNSLNETDFANTYMPIPVPMP